MDHVFIDRNTFNALQIFQIQSHNASFKHGGPSSNREGLSVYKLLSQHCKSKLGYTTMRNLLLNPIKDINQLNKRLDFIEFAVKATNVGFIETLQENIKKITDINLILSKIQYFRASSIDWENLYKTIYHTLFLHEICRPYKSSSTLLADFDSVITTNLYELEKCINSALEFKDSFRRIRPVIKFGLDEDLDAKKLKREDICKNITAAANMVVKDLPDYLDECVVVYVPEMGYLIAVKEWEEGCDKYQPKSVGFQFMFEMQGMLHYKNALCKEMDNQLGDIQMDIIAHENRIIKRLSGYILKFNKDIREPLKLIGLLDSLISISKVAKDKLYVRPQLNENKIHEIEEGRHPLLELLSDNFVSNNYHSGGKHSHVKLITGPNASGKSVFLKQIGLIVYLAHVGCFVPAKRANIGMIHSLHTRIHATESASIRLSAFMIDLSQMAQALYNAKSSSLVMIDEFGKGTTGREGLALQVGAIKKFLKQEEFCPHIIVSTHLQETINYIPESPLVSHLKMDYTVLENEISYLFKVTSGISKSFAIEVAASVDLEEDIISRAKEILEHMNNRQPIQALRQIYPRLYKDDQIPDEVFLASVEFPAPDSS